jgi:hypothetical protein
MHDGCCGCREKFKKQFLEKNLESVATRRRKRYELEKIKRQQKDANRIKKI